MRGKIIRGVGGFYYVVTDGGRIWQCRARGVFRKRGEKPLVGDLAEIEPTEHEETEAYVTGIYPRKNALVRPEAANVDQALVFLALKDPDPDAVLLDKFLVVMAWQKIPVIICFNKADLADEAAVSRWTDMYSGCGCRLFVISAADGSGTEPLKKALQGRTTVIAGPSGAGKSTLANLLQNNVHMATGSLSEKLGRGKNTTRHAELMPIGEDTFFCDTPGFTSLDIPDMEPLELQNLFPEFEPYRGKCRFRGCSHVHEPDCAVKKAADDGRLCMSRYENYRRFYEELVTRKKYRY